MPELRPAKFMERDSSRTKEYLRIKRLSKAIREHFEAIDLHERYQLLTTHPFRGLTTPDETESGENRRKERCPVYPERAPDETLPAFRERMEQYTIRYAAYERHATDTASECLEVILQAVEKLDTEGEFYDAPKESSLSRAERWMRQWPVPVVAARLVNRDWRYLLPPAGTQTSLV